MAFAVVFGTLTVLFTAAMTAFGVASPEIHIDAKAVALHVMWSAILAGLVTVLVRGAVAFAVGT